MSPISVTGSAVTAAESARDSPNNFLTVVEKFSRILLAQATPPMNQVFGFDTKDLARRCTVRSNGTQRRLGPRRVPEVSNPAYLDSAMYIGRNPTLGMVATACVSEFTALTLYP